MFSDIFSRACLISSTQSNSFRPFVWHGNPQRNITQDITRSLPFAFNSISLKMFSFGVFCNVDYVEHSVRFKNLKQLDRELCHKSKVLASKFNLKQSIIISLNNCTVFGRFDYLLCWLPRWKNLTLIKLIIAPMPDSIRWLVFLYISRGNSRQRAQHEITSLLSRHKKEIFNNSLEVVNSIHIYSWFVFLFEIGSRLRWTAVKKEAHCFLKRNRKFQHCFFIITSRRFVAKNINHKVILCQTFFLVRLNTSREPAVTVSTHFALKLMILYRFNQSFINRLIIFLLQQRSLHKVRHVNQAFSFRLTQQSRVENFSQRIRKRNDFDQLTNFPSAAFA